MFHEFLKCHAVVVLFRWKAAQFVVIKKNMFNQFWSRSSFEVSNFETDRLVKLLIDNVRQLDLPLAVMQ